MMKTKWRNLTFPTLEVEYQLVTYKFPTLKVSLFLHWAIFRPVVKLHIDPTTAAW